MAYTLQVRFNGLFLAGAPYEWAPYMLAYQSATFEGAEPGLVVTVPDAHVQAASARRWPEFLAAPLARDGAWLDVGAMPIPTGPVGPARQDDDNLWMSFYGRTAKPGIPKLEEEEAAAPRSTDLGSICIGQSALLQEYLQNEGGLGNQEFRIFDNVLYAELMQRAIRNAAVATGHTADDAAADPEATLGAPLLQTIHAAAFNGATKGSISIRVRVDAKDRPLVQRYVETRRALADSQRFNSPEMQQQMNAVVNTLDTQYLVTATDLAPPAGVTAEAVAQQRFAANTYSKLVAQLHLVSYKTPIGQMPVMLYMQQSDAAMDARFYGDPQKLERATNQQVASLLAATFANGQTPQAFLSAIERQYAKTEADALVDPAFLTALVAIAQTGTDVANARPYQSDLVRPNLAAMASLDPTIRAYFAPDPPPVPAPPPPTKSAAVARTATAQLQERVAAQVLLRGTLHPLALERAKATARIMPPHLRDGGGTVATAAAKPPTELDRETINSDRFTHIGEPHLSCDCEEGGSTSAHVLEQRYRLASRWLKQASAVDRASLKGRLLAAEARVLGHMVPYFIGGVVSEPYVDTSVQAEAKKNNTPPPHQELPIQGDALSQKSTEGGHGWGKMESILGLGRRILDGIERLNSVHPDDKATLVQRITQDIAQVPGWYARVPPLVLEGTGPVYPFVQPAEDVARQLAGQQDKFVRAVATRKAFLQAISYPKNEHLKTLSQLVRIQTPPYETKTRPNPMQYTSPFYYQVLHVVAPRLYDQWAPALGHTIAISARERTRGVEIGAFLRDRQPGGASNVALVAPHARAFSVAEWKQRVEPLLERCRRQLPRTGYLHHFGVHAALQGSPVSSASLASLAGSVGASSGLATHVAPAFTAQELANHQVIETADASDTLTTAQFFVPDWKLANKATSAQLVNALDRLQESGTIAAYAMASTKPMAQLGQMVHIVVALPLITMAQ